MIEFKHVSKTFHGKKIIDDISFQIPDGEFVVLLGESGCGKTTTLKMINKLILPSDGTVEINGRDISHMDTIALRRRMGYVIQQIGLFPHMTIRENIEIIARMKSKDKDRMEENAIRLMNMVNLDPATFMDAYPSEMSGGQQQRVALARAFVIEPGVLLMDEPLSNLDAKLRIEMRNAIKQIQRQVDITTVYVTHDQEEALAVSDRIAVMNGGVICQIGRPADIYKRPKNVFVSTFIGLSNLLDGHIVKKGDKTSISFKENEDWLVDMDNLSGDVEDGEEVIVSVRPEEFNMEPGTKEGIRGVIRSSVFLGLTTHYFITTGSGQASPRASREVFIKRFLLAILS